MKIKNEDVLEKVVERFKDINLTETTVDKIVQYYFEEVANSCKDQLDTFNKEHGVNIKRSKPIINHNVGTFWLKYDLGEGATHKDKMNGLGGVEKSYYPRLKVKFSPKFYETVKFEPTDEL